MSRRRSRIVPFLLAAACAAAGAFGQDGGDPVAIHEVFHLRAEGGSLVLRTTLPPDDGEEPRAFTVRGFGGQAELANRQVGPSPDGQAVIPATFQLQMTDYERPGERVSLVVSWGRGGLDIQKSTHYTGPRRYTRLVRLLVAGGRVRDNAGERRVMLMVNEAGDAGRPRLGVNARAADFPALLRGHRRHVEEHLRPLLRELGQEAVFAPEASVARQVFADAWRPAESLTARVGELLPSLGADDRAEREWAGERVAQLGPDAAVVLMRLDRHVLSAEQNSRIDTLIRRHAPLPRPEAVRLRNDVPFLLDCLNSDELPVRAAALSRLRDVRPEPIEFDAKLDVPARGAAVAVLRAKLVPDARISHGENQNDETGMTKSMTRPD